MTTRTSESYHVIIPVTPVPASRARTTRGGWAYYTGRYKTFRSEIENWAGPREAVMLEGPVRCSAEFVCTRPKKPANPYPIGDIDNYLKAIWDGIQGKLFIEDDKQITTVAAIKRFANPGEEPHIKLEFQQEEL